jgi:hypothetical protein
MTDTLEQSSVTMECFESFSAPLFASALLRSDLFDFDYHVLMREHAAAKHISNFFLYFSGVQVIIAIFLNFTPMWRKRDMGRYNKICPTIHYIAFLVLIFGIPLAKIATFVVAMLTTDIWETILGPWLTANCLVAIFMMGVWYPSVLRPQVEKKKKDLETERLWEETRLTELKNNKTLYNNFAGSMFGADFVDTPLMKQKYDKNVIIPV